MGVPSRHCASGWILNVKVRPSGLRVQLLARSPTGRSSVECRSTRLWYISALISETVAQVSSQELSACGKGPPQRFSTPPRMAPLAAIGATSPPAATAISASWMAGRPRCSVFPLQFQRHRAKANVSSWRVVKYFIIGLLWAVFLAFCLACNNNPYPVSPASAGVFFTSLDENPSTVDPQRISDVDSHFIGSYIHDTLFEFHYLKRPFQVIPSMADAPPVWRWRSDFPGLAGRRVYALRVRLRSDLRFADDECFATTNFDSSSPSSSRGSARGRSITSDDLILAIKRSADDRLEPFGKSFLMDKLIGFREFHERLDGAVESADAARIAAAYARTIAGVHRVDERTLEFAYAGPFPKALYFFTNVSSSPVPAECLKYYRDSYDRKAVASGAFRIREWRDHYRIVLERNPNYRTDDLYPTEGMPGDRERGLLAAAGRPMPLLNEERLRIIKRGPPRWRLFEQGYLDLYRNRLDLQERLMQSPRLLAAYAERGVRKNPELELTVFGWSFNLKDPLFENNPELRRAISLIVDREHIIELFLPGRAIIAHGPVPPGLGGYDAEYRAPYSRYDLDEARRLLRAAGYPDGVDPATGKALEIQLFDRAAAGRSPLYRYYIEQFAKVGLRLKIEELDFPSLNDKMHSREYQKIHWGWGADYPDPEIFLQLFYGPNADGTYYESQYRNGEYDALYSKIAQMPPSPERDALIRRMVARLAVDLPKVFLFHRVSHYFTQRWTASLQPNPLGYREMKYWDVDARGRAAATDEWNRTTLSGYLTVVGGAIAFALLAWISVRQFRARARRYS